MPMFCQRFVCDCGKETRQTGRDFPGSWDWQSFAQNFSLFCKTENQHPKVNSSVRLQRQKIMITSADNKPQTFNFRKSWLVELLARQQCTKLACHAKAVFTLLLSVCITFRGKICMNCNLICFIIGPTLIRHLHALRLCSARKRRGFINRFCLSHSARRSRLDWRRDE